MVGPEDIIDISNKEIETLGVDVSSEMIKIANTKIPENIKHLLNFECVDYMDFKPKNVRCICVNGFL